MAKFSIPGAEGRRTLIHDLRSGHAGWIVRTALTLVSALAILSVTMAWLGLLESRGGWVRDEHIALTMGVGAAAFCGILALLWWSFRRFQGALKAIFAVIAIWAIVLPTTFLIASTMRGGEEFVIMATIFLGFATSIASIILIFYHRFRAGPTARAIVHVRMACPECGYSLVGLTICRCPECGTEYTVDKLIQALGRGQVIVEETVSPSEPAQQIEAHSTPRALPEPDPA